MVIQVAAGTGTGPTKLSAFDSALNAAGVANYNLIHLSSIIPPEAKVIVNDGRLQTQPGQWGDKLYVVIADIRIETPNVEAWAGVGWVHDKKTGKGLFAEHVGESEATVKRDIQQSLEAFMAVRNVKFGPVKMKITGITCRHEPVCALVVAVYQARNWLPKPDFEDR